MHFSLFLSTLAGAGLVLGQSLSSSCTQTLGQLVTSPDMSCFNAGALASFALNSENSSIITPINNWVTGMCSMPACSNDTLSNFIRNVTSGCSQDLSNAGVTLPSDDISDVIAQVQANYPTARNVYCLSDMSTNTNCVTELLTGVQQALGQTLSFMNIVHMVVSGDMSTFTNVPSNVTCSNCSKAMFNVITSAYPSVSSVAAPVASSLCGASFTDASKPSNIVDTATTSTSSTSHSAAMALVPKNTLVSIATSVLVATMAAFVFLA